MLLATHTVKTNVFTHDKAIKRFVAEISDLDNIKFLPLYDDACDVGLTLVSSKTLATSRWHLVETSRDNDHDITAWVLHPTAGTLRYFPKLAGYQMFILND